MSTALYRRYRPESFADVIGQEHVTEPLMTALEKNRVNHAYLFSGPRGCGKTTSARILARCLNCAQGPTPTPCGVCESCKELSRDGGGSLDVIEMDAASHGGVDHARDLRERATFAPVRDRYKIFIIDEAHMVTREGFNALLKIVEEPPAHIKFIFATTEPNKVLGTIRSRTHHYPFRLVPPQILGNYLATLCAEEGVKVSEGVLPLVVRAGGGSVRDSLSILDQLMAGASDEHGISYDLAVALLGFTHGELLDEVVDAFASGSAAEVFASVDKVIQTGQDPRRFVEDLLERLRDLIIVKAVPDSAGSILRGLAADQLERMRAQAEKLGGAELSRAADLTNEALNEMSGAMNPQLHLELLCARILLAAGEQGIGSLTARLDRLERKLASGQFPAQGASQQGTSQQKASQQRAQAVSAQKGADAARPLARAQQQSAQTGTTPTGAPLAGAPLAGPPLGAAGSAPMAGAPLATAPLASAPLAKTGQQAPQAQQTPQVSQGQQRPHASETSQVPQHSTQQSVPGENTVDMVANSWADVVARVPSAFARAQFALCEPSKFEKGALFLRAELPVLKAVKEYLPQLQQALAQVLGLQVQLRGEIKKPGDGGGPNGGGRPNGDNPGGGSPGGGSPHPTGSNSAPEGGNSNPANSQSPNRQPANRQPVNSQPAAPQPAAPQPAAPHQPDVAEGPRGGEQAWAAHGQPRSPEPPSWSPNDWNNPVTSWSVAAIPSGDTPETPEATGAGHPAETPPAQPTEQGSAIPAGNEQEANQQAPDQQEANRQEPSEQIPRDQAPSEQPSPPHLRVIDGEADPVEMAKAQHPSNGSQEQHNIALAREVTPPSDTEQA
ncbi:MAG: DNA polymerase III subunit gamma and tau, partial [Rothia sp. (in: high G+C Gram-positive bacteria)]|nr:DNA polymerase III subunit gamma and tau [Rothia sp. (in: high G+C Gram-positive bacteria)]